MIKTASTLKKVAHSINGTVILFGKISSITKDGKTLNIQNLLDGEIRDLSVMSPYGISSSGIDGISSQIIMNDNENNVVVGVYDKSKPTTKPGEIIIYSKFGQKIELKTDGEIKLTDNHGHSETLTTLLGKINTLDGKIAALDTRVSALE